MAETSVSGSSDGGMGWIGAAGPPLSTAPPESVWSEWSRTVDHWSLRACIALFGVGVVLAFATSPDLVEDLTRRSGARLDPFAFAWRHLAFGAAALALLIGLSFLRPRGVRRLGVLVAVCGLAGLGLVLAIGVEHGNARRWLSVLGVSVQPSELAKPGFVVLSAWLLTAIGAVDRRTERRLVALSATIAAAAVCLLILQPDYGQSALIVAVWTAMFFVAGGSYVAMGALALAVAAIGVGAYLVEPHIAPRIEAFLTGEASNGQLAMAERAIMEGGWFGVGVGDGWRKAALPDAHADFVVAVAAEEYGFVLVAVIAALFLLITLRALARAARIVDRFQRLAAVGLALLVGVQAWVHLAVSAQIMPTTGMTLPFISLGGSSMLATAISLGMLLALTRRSPPPA